MDLTLLKAMGAPAIITEPILGPGLINPGTRVNSEYFGSCLQLDTDGSHALAANKDQNDAYIFGRTGLATWSQQYQIANRTGLGSGWNTQFGFNPLIQMVLDKLSGAAAAYSSQGSLSNGSDATVTALVRSGSSWSTDGTFTAETGLGENSNNAQYNFGCNVAIGASGTILLIAADANRIRNPGNAAQGQTAGKVRAFHRTGPATWVEDAPMYGYQGGNFFSVNEIEYFGSRMAMSADANWAVISSYSYQSGSSGSETYMLRVQKRTGTNTWSNASSIFLNTYPYIPDIMCISDDGGLFFYSDPSYSSNAGRVNGYRRSGNSFNSQYAIIGDAASGMYLGKYGVACSADGTRVVATGGSSGQYINLYRLSGSVYQRVKTFQVTSAQQGANLVAISSARERMAFANSDDSVNHQGIVQIYRGGAL